MIQQYDGYCPWVATQDGTLEIGIHLPYGNSESTKLTAAEAREMAAALVSAANEIEGAPCNATT
jgi:hypothetical protein